MVEPPEPDVLFVAIRQEWNAEWTIRTIHEWRSAPGIATEKRRAPDE
jgi:hypothetical protein